MGDSDEEEEEDADNIETAKAEWTLMQAELNSGFGSMSLTSPSPRASVLQDPSSRSKSRTRHNSAPPVLSDSTFLRPDYKRLHQTHTRLQNRVRAGAPHLSAIQTRGGPSNAHTTTIYCLQLYTYPATGVQVLFTGSRDRTVREWNLTTGLVERVISGVHASSVLSICVHDGFVASAGSDRRVAVWDLAKNELVKIIADHEDSVLCVRLDGRRLVSCSKDRTVRTYSFPDLTPQFVLGAHRAAVNAVSLSDTLIVSGSGDRSVRLWDATTGKLLRTFENHHTRGCVSLLPSFPFSFLLCYSNNNNELTSPHQDRLHRLHGALRRLRLVRQAPAPLRHHDLPGVVDITRVRRRLPARGAARAGERRVQRVREHWWRVRTRRAPRAAHDGAAVRGALGSGAERRAGAGLCVEWEL
jgi:hypothetical protein